MAGHHKFSVERTVLRRRFSTQFDGANSSYTSLAIASSSTSWSLLLASHWLGGHASRSCPILSPYYEGAQRFSIATFFPTL
jgi:hypothetical protein